MPLFSTVDTPFTFSFFFAFHHVKHFEHDDDDDDKQLCLSSLRESYSTIRISFSLISAVILA